MQIRKLQPSFYAANGHLKQALDNVDGSWIQGKSRGYGIAVIQLNTLTFAIPLRSYIKHDAAYITVKSFDNSAVKGKGLDYSKALLIDPSRDISGETFKIPNKEHKKLASKAHFITGRFEMYVEGYITAVRGNDQNILSSPQYRFSTLINYHLELGLTN